MALEKRWGEISAQAFLLQGTAEGVATVSNASLFRVKQRVTLTDGPNTLNLEVKRVTSETTLELGSQAKDIFDRADISAFTAGSILRAIEQPKFKISPDDVLQAVFEHEPVVALRTFLVDGLGNRIDQNNPTPSLTSFIRDGAAQQVTEDTVDPSQNRPLPVKLTGFSGDLAFNLETQSAGVYSNPDNLKPDNIGIIAHERSVGTDETNQTQRVTAIRGTVDADTVSQDVSLHDAEGEGLDSTVNSSGRSLDVLTPDNTISGSLTALNATLAMSLTGLGSIGFQISDTGTFDGTLVVQCSLDGGVSWKSVPFLDVLNSAIYQQLTLTNPNSLQIYSVIPLGGASHIRVLVTAYNSGSLDLVIRGSKVIGTTGQVTAPAFSTIVNTYPVIPKNTATLILSANTNRKFAYISNNSGSVVNIQLGSDVGLSATTGLVVPPNEKYELRGDNLYTGDVYAYTGGNGVTISISEGTP